MADCYGCRRPLNCSWYVYVIDSPHFEATSCFDISSGYLCVTTPDWIFSFCDSCWHRYTVALSSIIHKNQINALKQENYLLQQKLAASEQKCAALQKKLSHLDTQNQSVDNTDVTKLHQFIEQLPALQMDVLQRLPSVCIENFEGDHHELPSNRSSEYVTSFVEKLGSNINGILQTIQDTLTQRKQTRENILETLLSSCVSEETIGATLKPLEIEIEQIQRNMHVWNTFASMFMTTSDQHPVLKLFLRQSGS
ncbi:unnamed protein product [Adineta ricciae]|uniref:Uncharacterized protein n=1 Tax=Adineta ricciae TaxID=249248 RepID=A0A814NIC0_ADIRI|nr:unnamed protein product [Adineta ricciae]